MTLLANENSKKSIFLIFGRVISATVLGTTAESKFFKELPFDEVASTIHKVVPIPKASLWKVLRNVKEFWLYQATIPEYT